LEPLLSNTSIAIVIPVLDDWKSLEQLVATADGVIAGKDLAVEIIVVDDGSADPTQAAGLETLQLKNIDRLSILQLKRNFGHQRAITLGLAFVAAERDCDAVIVMDADGEDDPTDIARLVAKCRETEFSKMVFATRSKRSESLVFRSFYFLYRLLYKLLTGRTIRIGNFSIIPRTVLKRLVVVSEVWNHYAAGVVKARVPYTEIGTTRARRLHGRSKMNFVSLVTHGLSAISVNGDVAGVRLLIATCVLILVALAGIVVVVAVRLTTDLAIPGWATYVMALLLVILMQAVTLSLFFIFLVLNSRDTASFLPERDYSRFIGNIREIPVTAK
jgi:polyisoprenyl-phosphate glycosyltransferase